MSGAETVRRIAEIAEAFGWQAGVGASETAGQIVSYLAAHPEHTEALLRDGVFALPSDWFENGCLTWQGQNGKIVKPQQARFARIVKNLARPA